jgi:hypothetical protein
MSVRSARSEHRARRQRKASATLLAALAALATCGARNAAGDLGFPVTGPRSYTDLVRVEPAPIGPRIPAGFVGVSLEYRTLSGAERAGPRGNDLVLAQLIRNLAPHQTPVVRIGGDSTDWTWWPVPGLRRPRGVTYSLSPGWIATARALAVSAGARLILGVNLEANNIRIAGTEARRLVAGIGLGHIAALEIGNEPELYSALPWYHTHGGAPVFGRPPTYSLTDYVREFASVAKVLPRVPLAGPSTGANSWISGLGQLIAADPTLSMVTFHAYALNRFGDAFRGRDCSTPQAAPAHPTVAELLASYASRDLIQHVSPFVAVAHSHGLLFRVDEMNAVTCAGTPGVSNTAASALWAVNALFTLARAGVDGVNIHTWRHSEGKLFDFHHVHGQWVGTVRPEYYGLLLFARAAPPGSRLLPTERPGSGPVQSWAVRAPDGSTHVVLINDSLNRVRWVLVRSPAPGGPADLERLEAPSAFARGGITLAGQSFGARTTTGLLTGHADITVIRPSAGGYLVRLPPASAALLTNLRG